MTILEKFAPITFIQNDYIAHIDPLVVTLEIANITVKIILIDGESSAKILS